MTASPLLEMRGIVKRYGDVVAVRGAGFTVERGEVHALVGENGAGKSTLMKVLAGAVPRAAGAILVDGRDARIGSPAEALALGIGIIPQDPQLVPGLTVAENILLGIEPRRRGSRLLDRAAMARAAASALAALGEADLDVAAPAETLSVAHRQIVETARALARRGRVLAFDEPTAPLSAEEIRGLFGVIRRLRSDGAGILYISHRLDEIFEIADRVTVLRDGETVASAPTSEVDRGTLIRWMVGRELHESPAGKTADSGPEILRVDGIRGAGAHAVDLVLRQGEVLGLAGLVGAGRTEIARLIFGADPRRGGRIVLDGREIAPRSPREAIDAGIGLLTEDRNRLGLVPEMSVTENITLASLGRLCRGPFVLRRREREVAQAQVERLRIKTPSLGASVEHLSGGNRQKVVLARWIEARSRVLIFDEPTAGVDVGARQEIFALVRGLAAAGVGVIVISSDLDELLALATRIVVMREGRVAGEMPRGAATREAILSLATPRRAGEATA